MVIAMHVNNHMQGSLEVSDLIVHADTEVVFQLEYVVSWSRAAIFQTPTRDTLSRKATSKTTDKVGGK